MTRLRKGPSAAELEREYVYAEPPISITALADRHGLARSGVADKARIGKWYEKREAFRERLSERVTEALAEKWAETQVAVYERLMRVGIRHLDLYEEAVEKGEIKASTRDMLGVAGMMKSLLDDLAKRPVDVADPRLVNPDGDDFEGTEADADAVIAQVKRLMAGGVPDAGTDPAQ